MCSQSHKHTLYCWFTIMDQLLGCLFNAKEDFKKLQELHNSSEKYTYLKASAYSLWEKCEQYYKYTDNSAAYYTAQVLLSDKKWAWFQQEFKKNEKKKNWLCSSPKDPKDFGIQGLVEDLWLKKYKGKYAAAAAQEPSAIKFTLGKTFSGLHSHEQIKVILTTKVNAY